MIHPLPFDEELLREYGARLGIEDSNEAARGLAAAIACSPGWERYGGCSLLVRSDPAGIAVVGELTDTARNELAALADTLRFRCSHFRYVSYARAEEDCRLLAAQLRPLLEKEPWQTARLLAIPRGGHVVLGMLATVLQLPRERLLPSTDPRVPVLVVDDCALSGTRFKELLRGLPAEQVAFAQLYSHPRVREAIVTAEPRVAICLAAHDLCDIPTEVAEGTGWWDRLSGDAYRRVPSEGVSFAWGEPDRVVRCPDSDTILAGWRMIPPALCLKNRGQASIPITVQSPGSGPLRPGPDVFFTKSADMVTAAATSSGTLLRLEGLAAAVWRAIVLSGSVPAAEALLAEQFEVEPAVLRRDLESVVAQLTKLDLLRSDQA